MLGTILIVILVLALFGALPRWPHSRDWGYYPTGGVGLILFIVIILLVLGRIWALWGTRYSSGNVLCPGDVSASSEFRRPGR